MAKRRRKMHRWFLDEFCSFFFCCVGLRLRLIVSSFPFHILFPSTNILWTASHEKHELELSVRMYVCVCVAISRDLMCLVTRNWCLNFYIITSSYVAFFFLSTILLSPPVVDGRYIEMELMPSLDSVHTRERKRECKGTISMSKRWKHLGLSVRSEFSNLGFAGKENAMMIRSVSFGSPQVTFTNINPSFKLEDS